MRNLQNIFIFSFIVIKLYPQGFVSRIYLPHSQNMMTQAIYETTPGNYIGAGVSWDSINGQVISNLVMMGLNSNGQLTWTKKYAGFGINTFVIRSFYKRGNFLYRVGVGLDNNNKNFGTLLKIDLNGDTLWQRKYFDATDGCIPQMVTGSVDGGFLITGFFEGAQRNCMLIKTDANGNELWRKKISKFLPNVSDGQSILQDSSSKKIVITGYQYLANNSMADNVLITDSLGNYPNRTNYLSTPGGIAKDLIQTKHKKCMVVGYEYSYQSIGGNNLMRSYAAKFDLNNISNPVWKVNFGKITSLNGFFCVRETKNGEILLLGTIDTLRLLNINDNDLISLVRLDTNGQIKFQRLYNYKTNSNASTNYLSPTSLELTSDGGCIVSMSRINTPNPNPFIFVKYDSNGCDSSTAHCATLNLVGENSFKIDSEVLKIYPNPAASHLNIEYFSKNNEAAVLQLKNLLGETLIRKPLDVNAIQNMDLKNYPNGVYFLSLYQNQKLVSNSKIVIQQ